MAYVINVPHRELPYGELLTRIFHASEVRLNDKEAEQHVDTDYFEETFLSMCSLRREDSVWWLGSGANSGRDELGNEEENQEENMEEKEESSDSQKIVEEDKFATSTPSHFEWEKVEGEQHEQEVITAKNDQSNTVQEFFDVVDEERTAGEGVTTTTA
ncbi:hypothetical protein Dimus_015827 [Dionaea muscipula]